MHVHAAKFRAAAQLRKHLAGIEQVIGIEGAFDPHLLVGKELFQNGWHVAKNS